jgi:hypothetical protein
MTLANTLAYYDLEKITTVKSFITLSPGCPSAAELGYFLTEHKQQNILYQGVIS